MEAKTSQAISIDLGHVALGQNILSPGELRHGSISEIIETVRTDLDLKIQTERVRQIKAEQGDAAYQAAKKKLWFAVPNGLFSYRNSESIKSLSGSCVVECDHVPADIMERLILIIREDPYSQWEFITGSAEGVKWGMRWHGAEVTDNETWKARVSVPCYEYWDAKLAALGLSTSTDKQNKDISRAAFLCYDPDAYYNASAQAWTPEQPKIELALESAFVDVAPLVVETNETPIQKIDSQESPAATAAGASAPWSADETKMLKKIEAILQVSNGHEQRLRAGILLGCCVKGGLCQNQALALKEIAKKAIKYNHNPSDLRSIESGCKEAIKNPKYEGIFVWGDRRSVTSAKNGKHHEPVIADYSDEFLKTIQDSERRLLWATVHDVWYRYSRNAWTEAQESDIDAIIKTWLWKTHRDSLSPSMTNAIRAVIDSADKAHIDSSIKIPAFKEDGCWRSGGAWTSFNNGLLNIDKLLAGDPDHWRAHTPEVFVLGNKPYDYNPTQTCPKWLKYLEEVQPSEDARHCIQLMFGYLLTHSTLFNCFFILTGEGGCGKSVCVDTLRNVLGSSNYSSIELAKLGEKFQRYLLTERLANIVSEGQTESESLSYGALEGIIKDACDGGRTTVERKFGATYDANYTARLVFACNDMPKWADKSSGIWDRLRILPFNRRFRGTAEENPYLRLEIAMEEIGGVFNWSLDGARELRTLKRMPESCDGIALKAKNREDSDHELAFLKAHVSEQPKATVGSAHLYAIYHEWMLRNGYKPRAIQGFSDAVKRRYPKAICGVRIDGNTRGWIGIDLDENGGLDLLDAPQDSKTPEPPPPNGCPF